MEWQHSNSPCPTLKNSECKICWKNSRLNSLGSRWHPPHWLSSKGPTYQHGVLFISAGAIQQKMPQEDHQRGLVLARQCPGSPGTCNQEETGLPEHPVSWSPTLIYRSGPVGLPTVSWTEKTIEIFRPMWRHSWTDNILNSFWVACRSYSNGLRSVLSFVVNTLNKFQVWSL
jgi:hypothetical protein